MLRPSASTAGSIGIRLLDAPLAGRADPRARIYIVDHLPPGTVIRRHVQISNTTSTTAHVSVYSAAATISNGTFLGAAGRTANDLSTWTSVSPGSLDLPASRSATATVTVAVPSDAAPGERYGVVWAQVQSTRDASSGVTDVSRVGVRLYLSVGPGGAPASNFSIDSLAAERNASGQPVVVASVRNTGGRALDMSGYLRLAGGPGALSAGPFPANLGVTLGIDTTEPVAVVLDRQLPAGPWTAHITLHSGLVTRSASATITFPAAGSAAAVPTSHSHRSSLPAFLAGLTGLALACIVTWRVRRRSQRRRQRCLDAARVT
ncbi:MAG: hypothetical protein QOD07_2131 [Frankiaceae bacterium]|nr:hypothetical protein [Frankiaceae bacterium]